MPDFTHLPPPPQTDSGYVDVLASQNDVVALRDKLAQHPGAWVSFRQNFSLELVGKYSNHVTPEAIYAMPTDTIVLMADSYIGASIQKQMDSIFHRTGYTRRPTAVVFRNHGRVVSTKDYNAFPEDFERLHAYISQYYPTAMRAVESWRPRREYSVFEGSRALFWMTEKVTDDIVQAQEYRDFYHHPDKPRIWRELMVGMGIDAFEDHGNFITGDCRQQIGVFEPTSVEIVAAFVNPAAAFPVRIENDQLEDDLSSMGIGL